MRTIYLDSEYRCHLKNDGTMMKITIDFFTNKCATYVEGYRYVPAGYTWIRSDGTIFNGEMLSAAEDYSGLKRAQDQYELDQISQWSNLLIQHEKDFIATHNYSSNEYLSVNDNIYKTILAIPKGCTISINQNVIQSTIQEYLDSLKEEN